MNNMNEKKLDGATWLPRSAKDGFNECRENFLLHIIRRHRGEVKEEYIKEDGTRCEECWNLGMRVVRSYTREISNGITIQRNQWIGALEVSGMIRYTITASRNNGSGSGGNVVSEPSYYWKVVTESRNTEIEN